MFRGSSPRRPRLFVGLWSGSWWQVGGVRFGGRNRCLPGSCCATSACTQPGPTTSRPASGFRSCRSCSYSLSRGLRALDRQVSNTAGCRKLRIVAWIGAGAAATELGVRQFGGGTVGAQTALQPFLWAGAAVALHLVPWARGRGARGWRLERRTVGGVLAGGCLLLGIAGSARQLHLHRVELPSASAGIAAVGNFRVAARLGRISDLDGVPTSLPCTGSPDCARFHSR